MMKHSIGQHIFTMWEAEKLNPKFIELDPIQNDILKDLIHQANTPEEATELAGTWIESRIRHLLTISATTDWAYWFRLLSETNDIWSELKKAEIMPCRTCGQNVSLGEIEQSRNDPEYGNLIRRWVNWECINCKNDFIQQRVKICGYCNEKYVAGGDWHPHTGLCDTCQSDEFLHKEWKRLNSNLFRAKEMNTPATLTLKEWLSTIDYFGGLCAYCQQISFTDMEHFVPISDGGGTSYENCVPACQQCNSKKISITSFEHEPYSRVRQYLMSCNGNN